MIHGTPKCTSRGTAVVALVTLLALAVWGPANAQSKRPEPLAPSVAAAPKLPANAERFDHGRFRNVTAYKPPGDPKSFVLFASGRDGWTAHEQAMAQVLAAEGALVIGIDTPQFFAAMDADRAACQYPDGDLENLSHFAQAYYRIPGYQVPLLAGYDQGGALAYAVQAQSPDGMFGGALSLAFTPDVDLHKPLCPGSGVVSGAIDSGTLFAPVTTLTAPWIVLQGALDRVRDPKAIADYVTRVNGGRRIEVANVGHSFVIAADWQPALREAFAALRSAEKPQAPAPAAPADLGDLPVIEIAAKDGVPQTDTFALLMSGDGGWAGLDKEVAGALSDHGIPVVGLDSLRYYWSPRTPEGVARDVDKILRYYLGKLGKKRALLIGYSQGADVLPFALNRLPAATRAQIALGVVMGLSEHALFEFHMTSWVRNSSDGPPTMPEVARIEKTPLLCIYGQGENDSLCPKLDPNKVKVVQLPGGHHFNGDYGRLAQEILDAAKS